MPSFVFTVIAKTSTNISHLDVKGKLEALQHAIALAHVSRNAYRIEVATATGARVFTIELEAGEQEGRLNVRTVDEED